MSTATSSHTSWRRRTLPRVSGGAEGSIEFKRKSRIDRASRNEIAKFPVREFAKRKHSPHGVATSDIEIIGLPMLSIR